MINNIMTNIIVGLWQITWSILAIVIIPISLLIETIQGKHTLSMRLLSYPLECIIFDLYVAIGILCKPCRDYKILECILNIITNEVAKCDEILETTPEAFAAARLLYIL